MWPHSTCCVCTPLLYPADFLPSPKILPDSLIPVGHLHLRPGSLLTKRTLRDFPGRRPNPSASPSTPVSGFSFWPCPARIQQNHSPMTAQPPLGASSYSLLDCGVIPAVGQVTGLLLIIRWKAKTGYTFS